MNTLPENVFFDINHFPREYGMIVFPISMSRIANAQSPEACFSCMELFAEKMLANTVWFNFLYSEGLYMNFEEEKNHLAQTAVAHKGWIMKLIEKNYREFQIDRAIHFDSWFQMYLGHKSFFSALSEIKRIFREDPLFERYVRLDSEEAGKLYTEEQIDFYLEEHTMAYLLLNRELKLENRFLDGQEEWILFAYPGKPPRAQVYLFQLDPLKIMGDTNPYKGLYDLSEKIFIDYMRVDLRTWEMKKE